MEKIEKILLSRDQKSAPSLSEQLFGNTPMDINTDRHQLIHNNKFNSPELEFPTEPAQIVGIIGESCKEKHDILCGLCSVESAIDSEQIKPEAGISLYFTMDGVTLLDFDFKFESMDDTNYLFYAAFLLMNSDLVLIVSKDEEKHTDLKRYVEKLVQVLSQQFGSLRVELVHVMCDRDPTFFDRDLNPNQDPNIIGLPIHRKDFPDWYLYSYDYNEALVNLIHECPRRLPFNEEKTVFKWVKSAELNWNNLREIQDLKSRVGKAKV